MDSKKLREGMANTASAVQLMLTDVLKSKWLDLSEDEKNILGRPNFACGKVAHRMREKLKKYETRTKTNRTARAARRV